MSTILLADDDQLLRLIMRERLERAGHEVLECGDGFAALELAMEERPDCLILDVMMPLARGLEVVRQVRREESWHPGIVMVSARTRVTDRLNALEAGADMYLEKPIAPDALVEAVARVTEDRTPTRIVDILGPVWATLAMDRLFRRAEAGRWADRARELQRLFARHMVEALGRAEPRLPDAPPAMRVLWEQTLRALVGGVTGPDIPVATNIVIPDIATVLRATSVSTPDAAQSHLWAAILERVLAGRRAIDAGASDGVRAHFAGALRNVLGVDQHVSGLFAQSLDRVMGRTETVERGATILERSFSGTLADILGIHATEGDLWAGTLARVLAHRPAGEISATRRIEERIGLALDGVLRPGTGSTAGGANDDIWSSALDEILRGQLGQLVPVPDIRTALGDALSDTTVGHR